MTQSVNQSIEQILNPILSDGGKVVILGAGSSLNCDDGAGPAIADRLISGMKGKLPENIRVYNGCAAPENFTGEIKRFTPDTLLIIDAADFSLPPGSVRTIDLKDISGAAFSSHMLPIKIMVDYLEKETGCKTILIGIQPESVQYGDELSGPVAGTVKEIVKVILKNIRKSAR